MSKDRERLCLAGEAFVCTAMMRLMVRRLAHEHGVVHYVRRDEILNLSTGPTLKALRSAAITTSKSIFCLAAFPLSSRPPYGLLLLPIYVILRKGKEKPEPD